MSRESIHKKFLSQVERLGLGLSQVEFAKKMGVGEPLISMYLSGKRNVALGFLKRFCEVYGIDYDQMIKPEAEEQTKLSDRDLIAMFLRVSDAQTVILNDIRKNMAQASAQAEMNKTLKEIGSKLTETLVGVEFVSGRQLQKIMKSLEGMQAQKKNPSQGVRKKRDVDGQGVDKSGKHH